jgi:hypothetical protein
MGQFKPMVKMETTEPSVILKLKKGGHVNMKKGGKAESGHKKMAMGGGAMDMMTGTPALVGRPAVNAPIRAPGKPSMAMRRKAMMARPMPAQAMPPMKEGGDADKAQDKAMIKKAFKQHDSQEHKSGKGTKLSLKKGGKMATGGVTDGQGGYAKGGIINTKDQGGVYRNTKVDTARPDKSPAKTGDVKLGNAGGFKTGGVTKGQGGYKSGGKSSKKAYATGGTVNSGKPVAMPQGNKKPSSPVSIDRLAGTFKKGGKVAPNNKSLQRVNDSEYAPTMRAAKKDSNLKYGASKRMAVGGPSDINLDDFRNDNPQAKREQEGYSKHYANEAQQNKSDRDAMYDALMYIPRKIKDAFTGQGAITTKEREISKTITPPVKKRSGGAIKR